MFYQLSFIVAGDGNAWQMHHENVGCLMCPDSHHKCRAGTGDVVNTSSRHVVRVEGGAHGIDRSCEPRAIGAAAGARGTAMEGDVRR